MTQTSVVPSSNVTNVANLEPAGFGEQNADAQPSETEEVERLEALLFARTRSHGALQRELERKDRLLREALLRISTSTSQEFSALRAGYDAAVARAIEAELAKAELTFALDETRAQLTAAAAEGSVGAQSRAGAVYANGADGAAAQSSAELEALRGERSGLQARVLEAESALQAAYALSQKHSQRLTAGQTRVDELRAETAELTLLAQTRAARISELTQASGLDQQEIRALRAQVATATAAQVAQGEAREADRQLWSERLVSQQAEQAEREQAAWKAAAEALASSESRLREFLGTLQQPLQELDGALNALNVVEQQRAPKKTSVRAERASSGTRAAARAQQADETASAANASSRLKNSSVEE